MLYHILFSLSEYFSVLNVMRYLTFRSMLAFVVTLLIVLIFQPKFISWFRKRRLGQPIRDDGPQTHLKKQGTPTMGGLVVVVAIVLSTFLFANLKNIYVWVTLLVTAGYAFVGFVDDYSKVYAGNSKGVRARTKLIWQFLIAFFAIGLVLTFADGFPLLLAYRFLKMSV